MLFFGSETEFAIDEFVYAPAMNKLKLSCRLTKGNLNYISGIIAKSQLEVVKITTPIGIISIPGIKFVAKAE